MDFFLSHCFHTFINSLNRYSLSTFCTGSTNILGADYIRNAEFQESDILNAKRSGKIKTKNVQQISQKEVTADFEIKIHMTCKGKNAMRYIIVSQVQLTGNTEVLHKP